MLKILGSMLVIFSTTAFGFVKSQRFTARNYQLREIQRALYEIENEITYTYTPLPEAIINASTKVDFPLNSLLVRLGDLLRLNKVDSVYKAFCRVFDEMDEELYLTNKDKDILTNLGKSLGNSDIEGHKKIFSLALNSLNSQINDSDVSIKKNVKMYRYLGFCLGSIIVIMLI